MIIAIVKAKIISGKQDQLRTISNKLQHEYALHEEGCEQYESFIDGDTFIMLERWSSQEALDVHFKTDHVATYMPQLRECLVGAGFDVQIIKSNDVSFIRM